MTNSNITDWVIEKNNLFIKAAITLLMPEYFLKKCFLNNSPKKEAWKGKRSCLTISFDCDFSKDVEAIPEVIKKLDKFSIKSSFACVGYWVKKYPNEHKLILEHGHEIINHTYSHPDNEELTPGRKFKNISYVEKKEEIAKCHEVCKKILNYEPIGCRIPHFKNLFTPDIYIILKELGYQYSSSTYITNTKSYGFPFVAQENIIEFPLSTCPKHPFTVFDTWHSLNSPRLIYKLVHYDEKSYLKLFKNLLDLGLETNSYINVYIDPFDVLKLKKLDGLLDTIEKMKNDILIARYCDLMENRTWLIK